MRYIFTICILLIFKGISISQFINPECVGFENVPEFSIGDQCLNEGSSNFCVNVTVNDFVNVASFQYILSWNPNILGLASITELGALGEPIIINDTQNGDGLAFIIWSQFNTTISQPDGAAILEICFDAEGECGDVTDIQMIGGFNIGEPQIQYASDPNIPNDPGCLFNYPTHSLGVFEVKCPDLYAQVDQCHTLGNSGSITITPVQGTGPYTYSVNPGAMSGNIAIGDQAVIGGLSPDTYTIIVMDNIGDTYMTTVDIENKDPLTIDLVSSSAPFCANSTNGNLEVVGQGGETFGIFGYEYEWSNGQFTNEITTLTSGIYTVTVSDLNGCSTTDAYDLTVSPIIVDAMVIANDACGSGVGGFSFDITGGTPFSDGTYDVVIFNVPFIGSSNGEIIGGLMGDDYTIDVEDSRGCSVEFLINVPGEEFEYTATVAPLEDISCFGECDGSFTLTMNEAGSFTFNDVTNPVMGLTANVTTTANSITASDLCGGIWLVSATEDDTGCPFDTTIVINEPGELEIEVGQVIDNTLCVGSNGRIILLTSGGSGGNEFTWVPDVNNTNTLDPADPGIYNVTVTDVEECTATITVEVMQAVSTGEAEINVIAGIGCNGSTQGELEATILGDDIADYTIVWNDLATNTLYDIGLTTQVDAGEYELVLTNDISGCESRDTVELVSGNDITFEVTGTDLLCFEGADGIVEVFNINGGNGVYEVEWVGYETNDLILTTANAGLVEFTVRDELGCSLDSNIILNQPMRRIPDIINNIAPTCFGSSDGSITVNNTGGTAPNGYTFDWPGTMFDQSNVFESTASGLAAGMIELIISDDNNCMDTLMLDISGPDSLGFDQGASVILPPECVGACDGFVDLVVQGGTPDPGLVPYDIMWEDGNQSLQRSDLCPQLYTVTISDDLGCTQEIQFDFDLPGDTLTLAVDDFLTTSVGCNGDEGATVVVFAEGGAGSSDNFTYTWTDVVSLTTFADNLQEGDYTVVVTDSLGCTASTMHTVISAPELIVNLFDPPTVQCAGDSICFVPGIASGGSGPPYFYQIQNQPPVLPIDSCIVLFAGIYDMTVRDLDGCSFDTIIEVIEPSITSVDIGGDMTVELGDSDAIIDADYFSDFQIDSIVWTAIDTIMCLDIECTEVNIGFTQDQVISVMATDINGCTAIDQIQITVDEVRNVFLPTVFMPDAETERIFMVHLGQGAEVINSLSVYDRWGNEMYHIEDVASNDTGQFGWTGRFGTNDAVEGVYVYIVEVTFSDGETRRFARDLTLLR